MGIPKETADRVTPEREPLERKVRERASDSEREDVMGEELPQVTEDREPKTVLVRDGQGQESNKAKGGDPEGNRESLKVEMEMSKDTQKREREMGKPEPEREWEPAGLEVNLDRGVAEGGSHDQKEQIASPTLKPGLGMGDLEGLTSAPPVCGTQGDGGKGDPVSPGRQQRGKSGCGRQCAVQPSWHWPCTAGCTALSHSCFHSLTRPLELRDDVCWKGFRGELAQLLLVLPLLHKSPPTLAASLSTQPAFNLLLFSHCMYICAWLRVCVWGGA